jgi:hypothetical protein
MESKCKCRSDNEGKKRCKVMTLDQEMNFLGKLGGGMSSWPDIPLIFNFKSNFPLILYFNA